MLYKSDGFTPDDPFDFSEVGPTPRDLGKSLGSNELSDPFGGALRKSCDADRLQRIFADNPDLKDAVERGMLHVSIDAGVEHYEIVDGNNSRVVKQLRTVRIEDHQVLPRDGGPMSDCVGF